ncbi:MAG: 30S ribosomal protein S17 [Bdellovibrionales bacterium]|nr:30S ribosomal protein S17 [Bdellovibrionales bacterium]
MTKKNFITGQVMSHKSDKTISVMSYSFVKHSRYGKYIKRQSFFKVHDEKNQAKTGDKVKIFSVRPYSKTKRWQLKEIIEDPSVREKK